MANLDLTELLTDPDFIDSVTVTRIGQTVDGHGMVVQATTIYDDVAMAVQPATGRVLEMFPDLERASDSIVVYTEFMLSGVTDTTQADQIEWNGKSYTVQSINDYSNFASGWIMAACTLRSLAARSVV
mgnify:CR=1 FL=1